MTRNNLNTICPYFAMFPLDYPLEAIDRSRAQSVLDPFCGRGTTNVAARMNGLYSTGVDSSSVAYAISSAKMVDVSPEEIISECRNILDGCPEADIPEGEFWEMMYDRDVLSKLCGLRETLMEDCGTPARIALRGIILGALHGPMMKDGSTNYLSNQFPRTFASKPGYSVKFWKQRGLLTPPKTDIMRVVETRSRRHYSIDMGPARGFILKGDSTCPETFRTIRERLGQDRSFDTVITSPPYHGINTYIPDQWLRNWFVGGPPYVDYTTKGQTSRRLSDFISEISAVWRNCSDVCSDDARMFVRFGEMGRKDDDPEEIIRRTFDGSDWEIDRIVGAGEPSKGRRSSETFGNMELRQYKEIDVEATLI